MVTKREYTVLKNIYSGGYRYLTRDSNNEIYAHKAKPKKDNGTWLKHFFSIQFRNKESEFSFVRYDDDCPVDIARLIDDYESNEELMSLFGGVSKQEIPQGVMDIIEDHKGKVSLFTFIGDFMVNANKNSNDENIKWILENQGLVTKVWLFGVQEA